MDKAVSKLTFQLNQISPDEINPLLVRATFSVLDLDESGNGQRIEKETVDNVLKLIQDMPILAKYYPVTEAGAGDDNFGDHEPIIDVDREGNEFMTTDTIAIGHFKTGGRYETVDGVENVVVADAVLYADKYPNQVELLMELFNQGIKINTSCEYLYSKNNAYEDENGIEVIGGTILFGAHTILGSNPNGQGGVIAGAYSTSELLSLNAQQQWNTSLNSLLKEIQKSEGLTNKEDLTQKQNKKGSNGMFEKVVKLADDDIRVQLYNALKEHMTDEEFETVVISANNVKDNSFVYQVNQESEVRWYEVSTYENQSFTNVDGELKLDYSQKTEVTTEWYDIYNNLTEAKNSLDDKEKELKEANDAVVLITHNKKQVETKLTEATDTVVSLNSKVKDLETELEGYTEIKNELEAEKKEKALNELKEEWKAKFNKIDADEKFESEEVQNMLIEAVEDETKAGSVNSSLNSMIVDIVMAENSEESDNDESEEDKLAKSENSKVKPDDVKNLNNKNMNGLLDKTKEDPFKNYFEE